MTDKQTGAAIGGHRIFRIRPLRFKELLKTVELNPIEKYITLFTVIEHLPKHVGAIFIEKSDLETAFDEFMESTQGP